MVRTQDPARGVLFGSRVPFSFSLFFFLKALLTDRGASLVAQMVKNPPAMQETWVRSLGRDNPLEEGMAIHSSILA